MPSGRFDHGSAGGVMKDGVTSNQVVLAMDGLSCPSLYFPAQST